MQADNFITAASDPEKWVRRSRSLRVSADLLWPYATEGISNFNKSDPATHQPLIASFAILQSSQLLYALSIETALKGRIILISPSHLSFDVLMDGAGALSSVKMHPIGGKRTSGHDLVKLAELAQLLSNGKNPEERAFLHFASECILWRSRYPVPMESYSPNELATHLAANDKLIGFQTKAVHWIDTALDFSTIRNQ